jgi:hypothetical protein
MQEKHLYEYSIRVVPRVEREEFLNVGLLFLKSEVYVIHSLDIQRTQSLSAEADVEQIQMNLLVSKKWHTVPKTGDQLH